MPLFYKVIIMLNIHSVLKEILKELQSNSESIAVENDQHFTDKLSGVEFHLYDDYFQMTRGDDKPVSVSSFSDAEKLTIMEIKNIITDPEVTRDKQENYQQHVTENRQRFSGWYENPMPVMTGVIEEENTEEYVREP